MAKHKIISITHYSALYGANRSLLNLIEGTRDQVEWVVFCKNTPTNSGDLRLELSKLNVKHFTLPFRIDVYHDDNPLLKSRLVFFLELCFNFVLAAGIAGYAKMQRGSVIHTNSSATCLGAYVSYLSSIPHIWHFREFLDRDYGLSYKFGIRFLVYWANRAKRIISISGSIDKACVKDRAIRTGSNIIFNGVISAGNLPVLPDKEVGSPIALVIIGVIDRAKNQLEAIKAVQLLAAKGHLIKLEIVGAPKGVYYEELLAYTIGHHLEDTIIFRGYEADVSVVYKQADVTVMCSRNEGMGRVTIESMAYGTPVVGYNEAGTTELIEDGKTGVLYTGTEVDLALAVEKLILNRALYSSVRNQAYEQVKSKFTAEIYARNFLKIVES